MRTRHRLIVPLVVLAAAVGWLWWLANKPHVVELVLGDKSFAVEVVRTPTTRAKGLSGRDGLATSTGMLFVFPEPGIYPFWMKDMHFPIDIVWLDGDWCVVNITHDARPESYPDSYHPTHEALYVLEVNSGVIASQGVDIASCLQPPLI